MWTGPWYKVHKHFHHENFIQLMEFLDGKICLIFSFLWLRVQCWKPWRKRISWYSGTSSCKQLHFQGNRQWNENKDMAGIKINRLKIRFIYILFSVTAGHKIIPYQSCPYVLVVQNSLVQELIPFPIPTGWTRLC